MKNNSTIRNFFYPESIVLIGASSKPLSIGYEVLKMMLGYGYTGKIFIINPNTPEILNIKCNKSLDEIEDKIDLAIILVHKKLVFQSIKECSFKNIKNIVIITAGFKETGEVGAMAEKEIVDFAKKKNLRIVGPNCMGLINSEPEVKLNATFGAELPMHAKVGFISQSGALGAAVLNTINETGYCFNQFISIGNKCDVNENDLMEFWQETDQIKVIALYLESFVNGRKFFDLARVISRKKPILLIKSAKTEASMKAAISHTGALASSDTIVNAMLLQSGLTRVDTLEELFETAKVFEKFDLVKTKNVAILTNAGGFGIVCTDEIEKQKLQLAKFKDETIAKLRNIIVEDASPNNPVDFLPTPSPETYKKALEIVLEDENVDSVIAILIEPVMIKPFDVIYKIAEMQTTSRKPILITVFPLPDFWSRWKTEGIQNTLLYKNVELPVKLLANINNRYEFNNSELKQHNPEIRTKFKELSVSKIERIIQKANNDMLNFKEIGTIFNELKLPLAGNIIVKNFNDAEDKIEKFDFPVALKINSDIITHKSDVGGVIINISSRKELKRAFTEMRKNLKTQNLINKITGYEIQEYVSGGLELIIGGFRDDNFGPVIMFGLGGKMVELIKDSNFLIVPANKNEVIDLIIKSKAYSLLTGFRGGDVYDIEYLAELIVKIGDFFVQFDKIKEFDINPLILKAKPKESKIVDVRIKILK